MSKTQVNQWSSMLEGTRINVLVHWVMLSLRVTEVMGVPPF